MLKKNYKVLTACKVLLNKNVLLSPTDTTFGLSADATSKVAINKVINLKSRDKRKLFIVAFHSIQQVKRYLKIAKEVELIINKHKDYSTTFIIDYFPIIPVFKFLNSSTTIAIRIIRSSIFLDILKNYNKPLVTTSANISSENSPISYLEIPKLITENVGYIIKDLSRNSFNKPSKIIRIEKDNKLTIIRH